MPIDKPDYVFPAQLSLIDVEESNAPSVADARMRSESARAALDGRTDIEWFGEYEKLREGGWNWRVAAYIAWASCPKTKRTPKTQAELANKVLGLTSDRAITTWRNKNQIIDETVGMLQSASLWDHRAEVFDALVKNASEADYKTHNDRKLFLELTGDYVPSAKLAAMITKNGFSKNDLAELTTDELLQLAKSFRNEAVAQDEEPAEEETPE